VTDPSLRVSDEDRRQVVVALEGHTAAGRLSLDEFSDRVNLVYVATTHGELSAVMRDLPTESHHATAQPQLLLAFLVAGIAVVVLGILLALGH
jgi:cobalamin biosynthesis protein CbiG